ncbi:MAG: TraR/DksA family transcriptional regulator [Acidobacteriota bacterium]
MTQRDMAAYKKMLAAKRAELSAGLLSREEIAVERSADQADEIQRALERELVIRNLDSRAHLLRNVEAALERIEDGSYGVCLECEEEINPKRLAAVPWTALCIDCQERADREQAAQQSLAYKAA